MTLPTNSVIDDGIAEVCALSAGSRLRLFANLTRLSAGAQLPATALRLHRAHRVLIRTSEPGIFFGDGEALATGTEFSIDVVAGAIQVIA
jgi:diacylglycerol kinase family enzyme